MLAEALTSRGVVSHPKANLQKNETCKAMARLNTDEKRAMPTTRATIEVGATFFLQGSSILEL